jgi:putative hydrolase of the HAD superfamily
LSLAIRSETKFGDKPAAILFDLDNTLYPYQPAHAAGSAAVRIKASRLLGISGDDFDEHMNRARREVKDRLGPVGAAHSRLLYFQRFIELCGMKSQLIMSLDLEQTYWRAFLGAARLFPEVREVFDDLRVLGIPTGLVTDLTAQIQFRKLVFFGLEHVFEYVVTSEEAGADKPSPLPYALIAEKMGLVGKRVWMIGDNPDTDISGAAAALGAVTFQKKHEGVSVSPAADAVFDDFSELRRFFHSRLQDVP